MPNQKQSLCQVLVRECEAKTASTSTKTVNLSLLNTFLRIAWGKKWMAPKKRREDRASWLLHEDRYTAIFPVDKELNFTGYIDQRVAYWRNSWWKPSRFPYGFGHLLLWEVILGWMFRMHCWSVFLIMEWYPNIWDSFVWCGCKVVAAVGGGGAVAIAVAVVVLGVVVVVGGVGWSW